MNQPPDYQTRHTYFPAIEKPIIGMVNGPMAGLGLLYSLFCDVRFASDTAVFTTAFARRGLGAEYGMAWILARVVGHANALDLLLSGRKVLGAEALRLGLANQIYPLPELKEATRAYVKELVTWCAPSSTRMMKRALYQVPFQSLHEAVMSANQDMLTSNVSADFKEGTASFREKRPPRFQDPEVTDIQPMTANGGDGAIHCRRDGHVFFVVIDRPAKLNGFTPAMLRALAYAFTDFERDNDARCLVLSANGPHFTAGLDLPKVSQAWAAGETVYPDDALDIFDLRQPWRSKPMITAVQGICFTIGIELMLASDLVIAADDCRFAQVEVKRGILASGGATIRMVQRAGWANAMRYLLTGDEFDAPTALRFNFINEIVATGQQLARATELAERIANKSAPLAVREFKRNARVALEHGAEQAAGEFDSIREYLRQTEDAREGVQSFIEKRVPKFQRR